MLKKVSENIVDILNIMEEFERTVSEVYKSCGQIWPHDKEFWADMGEAEVKHAQHINRMKELILKRPESFILNAQFKSAAIKTAISGLRWHIQRLAKNELTEERMLYIARDTEQSILETGYKDAVRTSDAAFQTLMDEIVSDTVAHRAQLSKRIGPLTPVRS
jgi:hypothetical protein